MPELLKNSVQCGLKEKGEGSKDFLENAEQNEKCEAEKKVKKVVKARDHMSKKGKGLIDEGDLVDGASDLLAKNDRDSLKAGSSNSSGETEAVDDAELAIQLHRVMNSSPRILRGMSSGSSGDDASKIRNWKGLSYKRSGLGKRGSGDKKHGICTNSAVNNSSIGLSGLNLGLIPYRRDRKRRIWSIDNENTEISESTSSQQAAVKNLHSNEAGVECSDEAGIEYSDEAAVGYSLKSGSDASEDPSCDNIWQSNSCTGGGRYVHGLISYKRTRFKRNAFQMNGLVGVSCDSSPCGNHGVAFKSEGCRYDFVNLNTSSLVKSKAEEILLSGSSDTERDRYHLKYVKRIPGTKIDSSFLRYGSFHATDRYLFKYAKRVKSSNSSSNSKAKLHANALDKIDISATRLPTNCSAESRTLSDVSFGSFIVDLPQ